MTVPSLPLFEVTFSLFYLRDRRRGTGGAAGDGSSLLPDGHCRDGQPGHAGLHAAHLSRPTARCLSDQPAGGQVTDLSSQLDVLPVCSASVPAGVGRQTRFVFHFVLKRREAVSVSDTAL